MASQSLAASKRLRKELQVLRKSQNDQDDIFLQNHPDNLLLWKAWIKGPSDTPYEGGVFQLDIRCGMDYPLSPPTIKFVTKVGHHHSVTRLTDVLVFSSFVAYFLITFRRIRGFFCSDFPSQRSLSNRWYLFGHSEERMVASLGITSGLSGRLGFGTWVWRFVDHEAKIDIGVSAIIFTIDL